MSAPRLVLERMMHRQSIAVPGESIASYALLKLVPAGDGPASLPLTLALCVDISGSMYWGDGTGKSRLDRVRDAATAAVAKLKPSDRLALIAFGNGAEVVLPPTPAVRGREDRGHASPHRHVQRRSGRHDDGRGHQPRRSRR